MCEPTTIALAASAVFSAVAAGQQGNYADKVAQNNALSTKYAADDAIARGAVEEQKTRDQTRAVMGRQRAALAANGIDSTSGTGSLLLQDSAASGEFDALTVRNNAMKQAYGLNVQSDNLLAEGKAAKAAGRNQAIGSILTSGSKAYSQGKKEGLWGK
jgi:hypothetical protein